MKTAAHLKLFTSRYVRGQNVDMPPRLEVRVCVHG